MNEIIRFDNVSFRYDREREALKDISVTLYGKQKVAVLGNNGAGKSTFFLCCNGIVRPQSGRISLGTVGLDFTKKEILQLRQTVGLVFQDPDSQIIAGTVESEVSFGPMNLGYPREKVKSQVDAAISKMQLDDYRLRAPHYLSGGEKKRVSIADVIAMEPSLILFDEPTASLDPENTRLLEKNLDDLTDQGLGIVISTHDVDFAWKWADRILVFNAGRLVADAEPETVFSDEGLLSQCGLVQPTLFKVGRLFGMDPLPKTFLDLECAKIK